MRYRISTAFNAPKNQIFTSGRTPFSIKIFFLYCWLNNITICVGFSLAPIFFPLSTTVNIGVNTSVKHPVFTSSSICDPYWTHQAIRTLKVENRTFNTYSKNDQKVLSDLENGFLSRFKIYSSKIKSN